jgi:hypothetical protein
MSVTIGKISEPIFLPVTIRALVWAEKTTVFAPGTPDERVSTKRSKETICLCATTPEELTTGLLAALHLKSPDQLFPKKS